MPSVFTLNPGQLSFEEIQHLMQADLQLTIANVSWEKMQASAAYVDLLMKENRRVYGINTGFGLLANTAIPTEELGLLQKKILLSHAAGVGEYLPDPIVKLILLLKINALAQGYSGVRPVLLEYLLKFYNAGYFPCIPGKGSVGASGDLAPLSHLSLPLIGEGSLFYQGEILSAQEVLRALDLSPLVLAPKEGLALINGTQVSTALALYHLLDAFSLHEKSIQIGAMAIDAAAASIYPFHPSIHKIRGQLGQCYVAEKIWDFLQGSQILDAHRDCSKVQDPYSLRCQAQVLGASFDSLQHAKNILMLEANAVTDNPLIFAEENLVLSGGNFHAAPVAQVADLLAIAIAEIGALSERKIALLIDPTFNGNLPAFLTKNPGINSGFMIAHVTAAALASANKMFTHPCSVDSIPTSANQEDHVSMATNAAYRLKDLLDNVYTILSIEYLVVCQALELRRPLRSSPAIEAALQTLRQVVSFWDEDRFFAPDIEKSKAVLQSRLK